MNFKKSIPISTKYYVIIFFILITGIFIHNGDVLVSLGIINAQINQFSYQAINDNFSSHKIRTKNTIVVTPKSSIQYAFQTALPGDTIYLSAGIFKERIQIKKDSLTIMSISGNRATINGGFEIWGNYVKILNINFTNDVVKIWPDRYTIFLRKGAKGTQIRNNYFYNIPGDAVISADENNTVKDVIIKNNYIYNCTMGIDIHGKNWLVENNEIERLHNYGYGDSDYIRFHGTGHIIRNNFFHGTDPSEINSAHVDCFQTFRGNTNNILIEGNICYDFHQGMMSEQRDFTDNTNNITFINNILANFKKDFIDHSHGIIVHDSDHYIIRNNTFINMGVRGILFKDDPNFPFSPDFETIRDNIFYNVGSPAYYFPRKSEGSVGGYNLLFKSGDLIDRLDIEHDPNFVDYNNKNFHPVVNSTACGCGENGNYVGALPCN